MDNWIYDFYNINTKIVYCNIFSYNASFDSKECLNIHFFSQNVQLLKFDICPSPIYYYFRWE